MPYLDNRDTQGHGLLQTQAAIHILTHNHSAFIMNDLTLIYLLGFIVVLIFYLAHYRAKQLQQQRRKANLPRLANLPIYYGYYAAIWAFLPAFILLIAWLFLEKQWITARISSALPADFSGNLSLLLNQITLLDPKANPTTFHQDGLDLLKLQQLYVHSKTQSFILKTCLFLFSSGLGAYLALKRVRADFFARIAVERILLRVLFLCAFIAILTTIGIVFSVVFESFRFFKHVSLWDFLWGKNWLPTGENPQFGALPLFAGTFLISGIALLVAVPIGLMSAIYLSEYAPRRVRNILKPALELLAGVPTVVYGFFAVMTIAPLLRGFFAYLGISVAAESALVAGLVMGVMIIPFVSSLSDDVISAVPQYLRDGAYALGATQSEAIKQVVLPAALPGIVAGVLLAASRAIGETMIVVMAAGLLANLTMNPLEAVTTVTVQIVTLLTGDQAFDSPKTLAAFALSLTLFFVTLLLNLLALHIVKKYRERYE